jgi:succinate-acetate transporter protein
MVHAATDNFFFFSTSLFSYGFFWGSWLSAFFYRRVSQSVKQGRTSGEASVVWVVMQTSAKGVRHPRGVEI